MNEMDNKQKTKTRKDLKTGIVLSYLLIALNVLSGIILLPFITGSLGQSNYGIYSAASSLISMFLIDLGLSAAATRFISKYRVTNTQSDINVLLNVIFKCFFILTGILILFFVIFFFCLQFVYRSFTPVELEQFHVVYIMVAASSAICFPFNLVNGVLIAYDKTSLSKTADIVSRIVFIIATVICVVFNLGLYAMTACYILHTVVGVALKLIFVFKATPINPFVKVSRETFVKTFKEVISFSIWTSINSYARVFLLSFMTTILGVTSPESQGTTEISKYSISYQIETYVSYFATCLGTIFYPEVSRLLYKGSSLTEENKENFGQFNLKISHLQVIILAIIYLGLILCGNDFLQLWLQGDLVENYQAIYFCVITICSTAVLLYPLQVLETALAAINKMKYVAIANITATVIGIALAFPLSYLWGAFGCCLSIALGTIVRIILLLIFGRKYVSLKVGEYFYKTYVPFVLPLAITAVFGVIIYQIFPQTTWIYFLIKILAISICYITALCLFGLNKYEQEKAESLMSKITRKLNILINEVIK